MSNHYLNWRWHIVHWTSVNNFLWNFSQHVNFFHGGDFCLSLNMLIISISPKIPEPLFTKKCLSDKLNTLRPRQNGRHFPDNIFKCIFFNENVSISIKNSLKFVPKGSINNIPALVQIMAWCQPGDKPSTEPMMFCLLTYMGHSASMSQWPFQDSGHIGPYNPCKPGNYDHTLGLYSLRRPHLFGIRIPIINMRQPVWGL